MSWFFVFKTYGLEWRRYRRAFHQSFNPDACVRHQPVLLKAARRLLSRVLVSSEDISATLDLYVPEATPFNYSGRRANLASSTFAATLMQIVYGLEVTKPDDQYFAMVERVRDIAEDISVPGRYLVEAIPFLRYLPSWLPGMHFKRYACKAKSDIDAILERLHNASLQAKVMALYRNS